MSQGRDSGAPVLPSTAAPPLPLFPAPPSGGTSVPGAGSTLSPPPSLPGSSPPGWGDGVAMYWSGSARIGSSHVLPSNVSSHAGARNAACVAS